LKDSFNLFDKIQEGKLPYIQGYKQMYTSTLDAYLTSIHIFFLDIMDKFLMVIVVDEEVNFNFDNEYKPMVSRLNDNIYVKMLMKYR
jgi:hypothetical protein